MQSINSSSTGFFDVSLPLPQHTTHSISPLLCCPVPSQALQTNDVLGFLFFFQNLKNCNSLASSANSTISARLLSSYRSTPCNLWLSTTVLSSLACIKDRSYNV